MSAELRYADFHSLRFAAGGHPLTRLFSQRLGAVLAWMGYRAGLSPSAITVLGLAVFIVAAYLYATLPTSVGSSLACLVLLQLGYGLDCADGQLARATSRASAFGGWLDVACDHTRAVGLAVAALLWLYAQSLPVEAAATCAALFLAGTVVHIHTATALRDSNRAELHMAGGAQRLRWIGSILCDTATVLLLVAALRMTSTLLASYLAGIGLLYLVVSLYLARVRLV